MAATRCGARTDRVFVRQSPGSGIKCAPNYRLGSICRYEVMASCCPNWFRFLISRLADQLRSALDASSTRAHGRQRLDRYQPSSTNSLHHHSGGPLDGAHDTVGP